MQYKIHGTTVQTVDFLLSQNETLITESSGIAWMRGDVRTQAESKGAGGKVLGKKTTPDSISKITYTCYSPKCLLVFSPEIPGQVTDINMNEDQSIICQKPAFLCAEGSVDLQPFFQQKLGAAFGEGFVLYQAFGPGAVLMQGHGEIREYELRQGEVIKVDPGHVVGFEPSVNFGFAEDELIMLVFSGPGRIWLQTISSPNFSAVMARYKGAR